MQEKNDLDQRYDHGSTAPDYILGDTNIEPNLANVQQYILNTTFADPKPDYDVDSNIVPAYLKTCPQQPVEPDSCVNGQHTWHQSHWQTLRNDHVFAVMWGGGSTTSIAGLSTDRDDNDWLYTRLQQLGH